MATESPNLRRLRARYAALCLHAGGGTNTVPARRALRDRFEVEVDPECLLEAPERARRAEFARKAFYTQLAIRSVEARSARRGARASARQPADETAAGVPTQAAVGEVNGDDPAAQLRD